MRGELVVKEPEVEEGPDVPHHHVDEGVLDQAEEHKEGARGHEHVDRLVVRVTTFDC